MDSTLEREADATVHLDHLRSDLSARATRPRKLIEGRLTRRDRSAPHATSCEPVPCQRCLGEAPLDRRQRTERRPELLARSRMENARSDGGVGEPGEVAERRRCPRTQPRVTIVRPPTARDRREERPGPVEGRLAPLDP